MLYLKPVRIALENQPNLDIFQQEVTDILIEQDRVCGVETKMGLKFRAKSVILTAGTFLAGKIHIGLEHYEGGRAGDPASVTLSHRLRDLNLRVDRLKQVRHHVLMHARSISIYWLNNMVMRCCLYSLYGISG